MTPAGPNPSRGPLAPLLDLFSSIWLGVTLLSLLFIYSTIGSAFLWVRQARFLEMTEFEWFHWWPFDVLIALICVNVTVATLRRIPFRPVNYGVWMIHVGILILAMGSVIYFTTKVEGDVPVIRRQVVIDVPGHETVTMPAIPANRAVAGAGNDAYMLEVWSIDPDWELLSGEDAGERAYSVTVRVQTATQEFLRQLIAGYPQYTEDLVRGDDPARPFQRAVKALGKPLIDDRLELSLGYEPADQLYLANNIAKSWAIYLRERGDTRWVERPVRGLPLYNDYVASFQDVWMPATDQLNLDPLDVEVPAVAPDDPLPDVDLRVTSYLRYAIMEPRRRPGGDSIDPTVQVRLRNAEGMSRQYELAAFDPVSSSQESGRLQFRWVGSEAQHAALEDRREPTLTVRIPGTELEIAGAIRETLRTNPDLPFTEIEGTDYAFRVSGIEDELLVQNRRFAVAIVEIRRGETTFIRWVFDDPALIRDLPAEGEAAPHGETGAVDSGIDITYAPGQSLPPVLLVAGPDAERLDLMLTLAGDRTETRPLTVGTPVPIGADIQLTVQRFEPFTRMETRPRIVDRAQRDSNARELFAKIKVEAGADDSAQSTWVPYHHYPFDGPNHTLRRYPYEPAVLRRADGTEVEVILSRQRRALPSPVVLEDFEIATHTGGFSGSNVSILDWTSRVRFAADGGWTETRDVSVNDPVEQGGFWYFQAQWDPPMGPRAQGDRPSAGRNYTVLGVGNRNGVVIQLIGCCISVVGMLYAFYIKPVIRRRRRQAAYAGVDEAAADEDRDARPPAGAAELVPAAAEEDS